MDSNKGRPPHGTAVPPDPDPEQDGVPVDLAPGETPPDSGSTTDGLSGPERYPSRAWPIATLVFVVIAVLAVVGFTLVGLLGIVKIF
ncbi:DUF6480 family protein [Actinokineospora sp. G85]|uniref:DUF6480 family protein n=1 Tax=Actinokineospora sp. G85 TaxID=3406626 RepID=UPI003C7796D5